MLENIAVCTRRVRRSCRVTARKNECRCKKGPRANALGLSQPYSAVPQDDRTIKEKIVSNRTAVAM